MGRGIVGGEERIRKSREVPAQRGNPGLSQDTERADGDGTVMTREERRRVLRAEWQQNVLPVPPELAGFHTCWLSTNHPTDTIARRLKLGYELVRQEEVPGFDANRGVKNGVAMYDGYVMCNEMVLAKVPMEIYQIAMSEFHHYQPREEERAIRERVNQQTTELNSQAGAKVLTTEGFDTLGNESGAEPQFEG